MRNKDYNLKDILKCLAIIIATCFICKFTEGKGFVLIAPFVLAALFMQKVDKLVFWLILIAASPSINAYFMPKDSIFSLTYRGLMVVIGMYGSLLFLSRGTSKYVTPIFGLFMYLAYMFIPSASGWAPMISFLKLFLFVSFFMATAYTANEAIARKKMDMKVFRNSILAFAFFYIFGSLLTMPFPGISYMNAEEAIKSGTAVTSLFKGVTLHSQTLGMVIAFWVVFLYADLIYHIKRSDKLYIVLLLCGMFVLYKTSTRTAMGTVIICVMISSWYMLNMRDIGSRWRGKVISGLLTFLACASLATLILPGLRNSVIKFALKYADEGAGEIQFNTEYALSTRSFLVEQQMENFHKKPAIGWGFQVSEEVAEMAARSTGLILSAPVEKGVWVTAILEEGGVIGELIYVAYMIAALVVLTMRKAYMGATIFWAIHISNLGEFTMFSMSGVGGMWYVFLFLALAFDAKRIAGPKQTSASYYGYSVARRPSSYNPMWR